MVMPLVNEFIGDESGATAIEYGLLTALVAIGALGAFQSLGSSVNFMYNSVVGPVVTAALKVGGG